MIQLGFDAAQVSRLEKSMRNPRFCERVFSAQENALIAAKLRPAETAAAHFAAKEALGKALRCGIFGFDLRQAAVLRRPDGSPCFAFSGELAGRMEQLGLTAEVSLSHEGGYAFACVLLQPGR
ncbi:4'-phosphopantetheinyl transferase superfamily protein [Anaerofilum sp. BX8]|uniref:Holo-[acyl-carrier-protein] synthase n=1 Tax=Anaerofilum hominis TaxID=2763016 RepID=A0A923I7R3_9FIRM|nr:4'-phosphopantetheinyl transferase superfamily protein [Anaerofilum hominis]MBC5580346.1 4'-phosphopantetheinyl transferase superfamily protein [Anaerofilum hominis]